MVRSVPDQHPATCQKPVALIKGAGDLATGVAIRLKRCGFDVVMTEIPFPTAVRRSVAFAEAVYEGRSIVEGVAGAMAADRESALALMAADAIPILVDPAATARSWLHPLLLVDAILAKRNLGTRISDAPAVVGLGPGFVAGVDAHAVVETQRGHTLGRVLIDGAAKPDTGVPGEVGGFGEERLIRAPGPGVFRGERQIGDRVSRGQSVGYVGSAPVRANLDGILRGLLHTGVQVTPGFKLGDIDPRADREHCFQVSDKALAVAGGVLEAACRLLGGAQFRIMPAIGGV
jgi:xanthine dehydrogenase accessory factor